MTTRGLLVGILAGFLATVILTVVLPRRWGHIKAILAATVGFLVALGLAYTVE